MVEVAVRDQDRAAGGAETAELELQRCGIAAGIDDDGLGRLAARAHDVAVRLQRPEPVCVDDEGHAGESSRVMCSASWPGYDHEVRHWKLNEIETPDGSRSPVVLHSLEGESRVVLIGLDPGQELGEHQVKESAFVLVVDGRVRVDAGDETIDAGAGELFRFDPDERHCGDRRRRRTADAPARALARRGPLPGRGRVPVRRYRFLAGVEGPFDWRAIQRRYAKRSIT